MKRHTTYIAAIALLATASYALAEDEKHADKPAPIYSDEVPGTGPIRAEDWFVKTWNERRSHFREQEKDQHGDIVFFGDSITQGWSDDFRGMFGNIAKAADSDGKHPHPGPLPEGEGELRLANRGISGDTTRGLLARVDEDVLALDPRAIVLLIGTNDLGIGIAPLDVAENLKLLLAKIAKHDPKVPVILCAVMPSSKKKQRPADKIRALNDLYGEAVRENPQVTMVDLYTLYADEKGDAKEEEFPDLLHPNDDGYRKWRAALWPVFATLGFVDTQADKFKPEEGFELLFDGKDLDGWEYRPTSPKELETARKWMIQAKRMPGYPIVEKETPFDGKTASDDGRYRVVAGRLVVATPSEGRRIQRLDTKRDFEGDFTLKLDFRATPNADSGVFVRGKQLQCRDYKLAGPYKDLKKYRPQDWNSLVVEVHGNKARCTCNGEVIEEAFELPEKGAIGLEGDRGQMEYRRIRISSN
jgi:lysophospholipase L1-like esterase